MKKYIILSLLVIGRTRSFQNAGYFYGKSDFRLRQQQISRREYWNMYGPTLHVGLKQRCVPNFSRESRLRMSDAVDTGAVEEKDHAWDIDPMYRKPLVQVFLLVLLYIFHLFVLTQHEIVFPVQLIPNNSGKFQSIGLDSVAGILSLGGLLFVRRKTKDDENPPVPSVFGTPTKHELPWKLQKNTGNREAIAGTLLVVVYFLTGFISQQIDEILYILEGNGVLMSVAMHRSLQVLFGHFSWVLIGSTIIRKLAGPFFTRETDWFRSKWNTFWLGWVMGGYFVSSWLFNVADLVNQLVLPASLWSTTEGVVAQLINPENNDFIASIFGFIAPCLSAPWWEEVLYRGFMLPALARHLPVWMSVVVSGFIFSIHHMSPTGFLPLWTLGMVWAGLYLKCRNILVTIIIHAMWNSRVFLGSWLGL